jgi:hypothetical protein
MFQVWFSDVLIDCGTFVWRRIERNSFQIYQTNELINDHLNFLDSIWFSIAWSENSTFLNLLVMKGYHINSNDFSSWLINLWYETRLIDIDLCSVVPIGFSSDQKRIVLNKRNIISYKSLLVYMKWIHDLYQRVQWTNSFKESHIQH